MNGEHMKRYLLIFVVLLVAIPTLDMIDASREEKNKREDAEALLLNSIKPDENDSDQTRMFMDEDPFFTWKGLEGTKENPIFSEGETLEYVVSWMGINAGTITMTLEVEATHDNAPAYKAVVVGKTNKTFSVFFKVHDVITSYFDPASFNSMKYIKDVREGHYKKFKETFYDQEKRKARVRGKEFDLPPNSKDPIACIYALRRFSVESGKSIRLNSNSEGKSNFPVKIGFTELEEIKLDDGVTRLAIKGLPLPTWEGRVFEKNQSHVKLWLSADEYSVPLKLESKVRIGTMKAELIERRGPGWEINIKKDE